MFAVIKNVFDCFVVESGSLLLDDAIDVCSDVIRDSHGGEAYVVESATAHRITGSDCQASTFKAFGIDGKPFVKKGEDPHLIDNGVWHS